MEKTVGSLTPKKKERCARRWALWDNKGRRRPTTGGFSNCCDQKTNSYPTAGAHRIVDPLHSAIAIAHPHASLSMRSTVRAKKKKVATLIANITGGRVSTCLVGFYTPFFSKPMGPYRGRALELPKLTFFKKFFARGTNWKEDPTKEVRDHRRAKCTLLPLRRYLSICLPVHLSTTICVDFSSCPTPIEH